MLRLIKTRNTFDGRKSTTLDMGALHREIKDLSSAKSAKRDDKKFTYTESDVPITIKASALE